ncbi:sirohydrochlorin chelatase [Rhodococcus sp. BP22]|uniref:sirohydrochlorin chelatase n=1 Tax=Rhodococcus sp. BP22 TaxID=2758566 RepID=UPI001645E1D5|nr:sirohydrochlorin chelatase [Rhodococcus sp. BP22]
MSVLIATAHGSRDPRSARTVHAVVDRIRLRRPDVDVRVAFLDLTEPHVDRVIDDVALEGADSAVVVPLLLGSAFHARVDLPTMLGAARLRNPGLSLVQADVLGEDQLLVDAVRSRIFDAGVEVDDPDVGVLLAAVGSSDGAANERTRAIARQVLTETRWREAVTCFATVPNSGPAEALRLLHSAGARKIVLAQWFLAPGLLTDRVSAVVDASGFEVVRADVIGAHSSVAEVVSHRYDCALTQIVTADNDHLNR